MAGAKETPRQKLISLMYLVFITMLALNVSKEVLDGFGQMYVKISDANLRVADGNTNLYENIEVNAQEKEGKWVGHDRTAKQIKKESDALYNRIAEIITTITEKQREKDPELKEYSQMDKGEALDVIFFKEGKKEAFKKLKGLACKQKPLTKRELQVLDHACSGLSSHLIAKQLTVSLPTVKFHLGNIYNKLGVKGRNGLLQVISNLA